MLRLFCNALRHPAVSSLTNKAPRVLSSPIIRNSPFSTITSNYNRPKDITSIVSRINCGTFSNGSLLLNKKINEISSSIQAVPSRSLTKFSMNKGKRKAVKPVIKRFFRLHWGGWIRTRCGRHKKIFKKSPPLQRRLRQHIFVNGTQAWLLDSMVTKFWRKPRHYVDDPYAPYHTREEFHSTRRKPWERE